MCTSVGGTGFNAQYCTEKGESALLLRLCRRRVPGASDCCGHSPGDTLTYVCPPSSQAPSTQRFHTQCPQNSLRYSSPPRHSATPLRQMQTTLSSLVLLAEKQNFRCRFLFQYRCPSIDPETKPTADPTDLSGILLQI